MAGLCGGVAGFERTKHQKAAGLRTYIIVAVGAALFTIASKYGFLDVVHNGIRLDVSRVACNIVTGVGFLGAGTIFMYGNQIRGLVTSAGIWVMAAVGMAVGAGMYVLAIIATAITVVIQSINIFRIWMSKFPEDFVFVWIRKQNHLKSWKKY